MISVGNLEPSTMIELTDPQYFSDLETDSFGSDSSVSDGLPMQLLHASIPEVCLESIDPCFSPFNTHSSIQCFSLATAIIKYCFPSYSGL